MCLFLTNEVVAIFSRSSLKLNRTAIYHWRRQPYFSSEPLSKTGYLLGVCYGRFRLHGLTRAARSENRE